MKNTPLVSVVIPVYNVEEYLPQGLGSLVLQTCKKLEIICVDDGSTDNSLEILNGFAKKDKRIKIIRQKNAGVSAARNSGLKVARGKYVHFMDSDDYVSLNYYEKMVATAEYANADMVTGGIIDSNGNIEISYRDSRALVSLKEKICTTKCVKYCSVWRYLFRRTFLTSNKFRFVEGIYAGEDLAFIFPVVKAANLIMTVPDAFYYYIRYRPSSIMRQSGINNKIRDDGIKWAEKIRDKFIMENNIGHVVRSTTVRKLRLFGAIPIGKIITKQNNCRYFYLFGLKLLKITP
ncbi:MAG: glycosyltransferase [Rickettsiales bacterium]|nr:glycosyltransferase [Rickettsiales bacterium]